jgi:hypothetical protein
MAGKIYRNAAIKEKLHGANFSNSSDCSGSGGSPIDFGSNKTTQDTVPGMWNKASATQSPKEYKSGSLGWMDMLCMWI